MNPAPGVRVRVFGWPETWRIVPSPDGDRWRFRIVLARESIGRSLPPFLQRSEWTADELAAGLASIKEEIRRSAEAANRRAFLVDEDPEDL